MAKQKRVKRVKQRKKFKDTGFATLMKEVGTAFKKTGGEDVAFASEYQGKEIKVKAKRVKSSGQKKSNLLPLFGIGIAAVLLLKN
jgi:hypothetical protein